MTLTLANNPGGSTLSGPTTVAASGGVAVFSGLSLNNPGVGYILQASGGGLTPVDDDLLYRSGPLQPPLQPLQLRKSRARRRFSRRRPIIRLTSRSANPY